MAVQEAKLKEADALLMTEQSSTPQEANVGATKEMGLEEGRATGSAQRVENNSPKGANLKKKYAEEGKSYLTIAFGCTGGKHRSVFVAEKFVHWLKKSDYILSTRHRDLTIN